MNGMDLLQIQGRDRKRTRGMEHLSYADQLEELELLSLEKNRLWKDFIMTFQYLKGACQKGGRRIFYTGK